MKHFDNLKMVLFDSTNASFRLAVEAQFSRLNPDGTMRDLVYTTDRGTGILNPNIYLTLAYKSDDMTPVYTSYPQLFRLRECFEKIKNLVIDNKGFMMADNVLTVRSDCADPVVMDNIGKKANWISLKLAVVQSGENGVISSTPGVAIEMSTSNRYASVLTSEEFLTLYTIIKDLNLSNIQCMMSLAYLNADNRIGTGYNSSQGAYIPAQPTYQPYQQPAPSYPPQQNWGNQSYQQQNFAKPRYGTNNYRAMSPAPQRNPAPQPTTNYQAPAAAPERNETVPMAPRNNAPIMNMKAVEETPISEISYDDTEALNSIFDGN